MRQIRTVAYRRSGGFGAAPVAGSGAETVEPLGTRRADRAGAAGSVSRAVATATGWGMDADRGRSIDVLIEDRKGRYQICGPPNAFSLYGFDDQIPNRIYVYNNRLSGDRRVGTVDITLIKRGDAATGDTEEVTMAEGRKLCMLPGRDRWWTAIYDWSRSTASRVL